MTVIFYTGTSLVQQLMTVLISEHGQIFGASPTESLGVPSEAHCQCPHGAMDWISKAGREEYKLENGISSPVSIHSEASSSATKATTQEPNNQRNVNQPSASSPSKRGQTLPTWKYSFWQQGGRSISPKLGNSSLDIPSLPSNGNWLMNGLYSLQVRQRTFSGGRIKGSSQRLSTYDNVPTSSLSLSIPSSASTSWSTSSCEISLPGDSVSSCAACRASDSSALSSLQMERATPVSLPQSEGYLDHSLEKSETCSSEHSNLPEASKDSVLCSGALQGLIAELKTTLSKQRTEYESSIKR